jgi:plastocyanin
MKRKTTLQIEKQYKKTYYICLSLIGFLCCCLNHAVAQGNANNGNMFKEPYVDIDEWRDIPVKHRYVHGGFKDTDTRFSFYFPPVEQYKGRFFQFITPIPDSENLAQLATGEMSMIGFCVEYGAYFVETNGGGIQNMGTLICAYQANSASAEYSRQIAVEMYGGKRPYGYAFGGSGGAYRTIGGLENTDTWDGVAPFVVGSPMAIPNVFCVRMHAMRILKDKFPQIIDAMEPGGSGDMYAGLNGEETAALKEVTKMGFPVKSWYAYETMGVHGFAAIYGGMAMMDATYFKDDFWSKEGYLGADKSSSIHKARLQRASHIKAIIGIDEAVSLKLIEPIPEWQRGTADAAWKSLGMADGTMPVAFQLEDRLPNVGFIGGDLIIKSGEAAGQSIQISSLSDDKIVINSQDMALLSKIKAGDEVQIDNSNFLAAQTYHRHQVPDREYRVWNQFRDAGGNPVYPQRPMLLGPLFTQGASGYIPTGKYKGKMIMVCALYDREAFPWQGDWYREFIKKQLGDKTDEQYRLWYVDRTTHAGMDDPLRTVGYFGVAFQALLDLSDWVERGIAPPATTEYVVDDGQVIVAEKAADRKGVQPVVTLTVNGGKSVEIKAGDKVEFVAETQTPPRGGNVVAVEWNFEGGGEFANSEQVGAKVNASHVFTKPGTYFPVVRIASQRKENTDALFTKVQNLDRVRVVVK